MPRKIGRFLIVRELGHGGMGVVYSAYDEDLDRKIAIKVYDPKRVDDPNDAKRRLLREAQALAKLSHPNVVQVYEVGTVDDQVFVAMEFVKGVTLRRWLADRPRASREILEQLVQAGRGLSAAHASGIVHRDFKPDNVLVGDDGRVRVVDFGLAHAITGPQSGGGQDESAPLPEREAIDYASRVTLDAPTSSGGALFIPLTGPGQILGTPAYMSPEQLRGYSTGAATDQYSFSVALYEALYHERPFDRVWWGQPPPFEVQGEGEKIPERMRKSLERGLSVEAKDRFASLDELLAALTAVDPVVPPPPKKKPYVLMAVGAFAAAAAIIFAVTDEPPCRGAARELGAVWNDARKESIRGAFLVTHLPFAEGAWQVVVRQLDAYAGDWIGARTNACEATVVKKTQSSELFDLRMACLDQRRRDLEATLAKLAGGGAELVERAPEMVLEMRPLEVCSNTERLRLGIAPPQDRSTAKEVERIRKRIAEARALELAGDYREGLRLADLALADTAKIDYAPLRAEALHQTGTLLGYVASPTVAVARLLDAIDDAEASRHDDLAAESWSRLTAIGRINLADPERAREWSRRELAAARRLNSKERLAAALANSGGVNYLQGHYEEAEKLQREAIRLLEEQFGKDHLAAAKTLHDLANTLAAASKSEEAIATYERVLSIKNQLGAKHPMVANLRYDLALLRIELGQLPEARRELEEVLKIWSEAYGPDHREAGRVRLAMANLEMQSGNLELAETHARRAREIYDRSYAEENPLRAEPYGLLGVVQTLERKYADARDSNQTMLAIYERTLDANDMKIGIALSNVGEALVGLGRHRDALAAFERSEKVLLASVGKDHQLLAYPLKGKAQALLGLGSVSNADAALRELEHALQLHVANPGDETEVADVKWTLARALSAVHRDPTRARVLAEEASKTYASLGDAYVWRRELIEAWLGARAAGKKTEVAGNVP